MKNKRLILKSIFLANLKGQPYKLNFAITSACNSRCQTCQVWQAYLKHPQIAKKDLKTEQIEQIFKSLPSRFVWLSLSGGEPFLRNDLVEICQAAVKHLPNLGLISIPSNGLLEDKIIKETQKILSLPVRNLFLNFSLDGPPAIHDQIRGIQGAYRKTWRTYSRILKIAKKNPRLHVNLETTISKYNINHLEKHLGRLVGGGHKITITIAHTGYLYKNTQKDNDFTNLSHETEKLQKIIKIVKKSLAWKSPVDLIERIYLNKILSFYQNPEKQPLPCIALRSSLAMDAHGNLIPCFMWGKKLGNLRHYDYSLKKFFQAKREAILKNRELISKNRCPNCWTPCEAYQSIINQLLKGRLWSLIL